MSLPTGNILKDFPGIGSFVSVSGNLLEKAGMVSRMAGGSRLGYPCQDGVAVAVHPQLFHLLEMAAQIWWKHT